MLAPGTMFDRYRIEQEIGAGGMGRVYRAFDTRLQRMVALKVLLAPAGPDAGTSGAKAGTGGPASESARHEATARLIREARAAAALVHANVISVFDVGEVDGAPYLVMEFVAGVSLRALMTVSTPIALRLRWLADVARGLGAAHRAGLVHRDVKPENVMVREDGAIKVLDFGIARGAAASPQSADRALATITAPNVVLGTLLYMAPEQIRRDPVDARTDQFAWGILAYELLAGAPPWKEGDSIAIIGQILTEEPAELRDRVADLPAGIDAVIARALQKNPAARFPSIDEAADAIEPFAEAPTSRAFLDLAPVREAIRNAASAAEAMAPTQSSGSGAGSEEATSLAGAPTKDVNATAAPLSRSTKQAAPSPPRRRVIAIAAAALVAAAVASAGLYHRFHAPSAVPSAAPRAPPSPMAVTDLPAPPSKSSEAIEAYQSALRAFRSGARSRAMSENDRAVALDPALAAAHLQQVIIALDYKIDASTRQHFREAEDHREALSERDRALLDAIEPGVRHQPADWKDATARVRALLERFPTDAELWYVLGNVQLFQEGTEAANGAFERAVAIDPAFALAHSGLGEGYLYVGRFDDARRTLDQCIKAVPSAVSCMILRTRLAVHEGSCELVESMGRRIMAIDSQDPLGPQTVSVGIAGRLPLPALREILNQKHAALPAARRRWAEARDEAVVSALAGDFTTAERRARDLERENESSKQQGPHGMAARLLAEILLEEGRDREAGQVAEAFLARREAWESDPRGEDFAMAEDATPALLAVARRSGRLRDADFESARGAWLAAWKAKSAADLKGFLWLHGYAFPAALIETREEADRALAALPAFAPLPSFRPFTLTEAAEGVTLALAGRAEEAIPKLAQATRTCRVLDFPIEHTRAYAWLGAAREAAHDTPGACAAYQMVMDRWGNAKPRSVTGARAKARITALKCGAP